MGDVVDGDFRGKCRLCEKAFLSISCFHGFVDLGESRFARFRSIVFLINAVAVALAIQDRSAE